MAGREGHRAAHSGERQVEAERWHLFAQRLRYDPTSDDVYHCPAGKRLGTSGTVREGKTLLYRASQLDCDLCPLKAQCRPEEPSRKIPRNIHEHARDIARSFAGTEDFEQTRAGLPQRQILCPMSVPD
jgi:hypothetical protein